MQKVLFFLLVGALVAVSVGFVNSPAARAG